MAQARTSSPVYDSQYVGSDAAFPKGLIAANDNVRSRTWGENIEEWLTRTAAIVLSAAFYFAVGYAFWRSFAS